MIRQIPSRIQKSTHNNQPALCPPLCPQRLDFFATRAYPTMTGTFTHALSSQFGCSNGLQVRTTNSWKPKFIAMGTHWTAKNQRLLVAGHHGSFGVMQGFLPARSQQVDHHVAFALHCLRCSMKIHEGPRVVASNARFHGTTEHGSHQTAEVGKKFRTGRVN